MKRETHLRIFETIVGALFLLPLVFYSGFLNPFGSTQTIVFVFLIELLLPYYFFLLFRFPDLQPNIRQPFVVISIIFFGITTISALLGIDPRNSFLGNVVRTDGLFVYYHLCLYFLFLQFVFQTKKQNSKILSRYLIYISSIAATLGILQFFSLVPSFAPEFGNRASSTLGNPIFFAASLVIPFFLAIQFIPSNTSRRKKIFMTTMSILLLGGILASGTRGALFGLLAGIFTAIILWILLNPSKIIRKRGIIFLFFSIFFLTILFFSIRTISSKPSILYRLTHFTDGNISSRLTYWNMAIKGWMEQPWFGVGHQNFYHVADKFYHKDLYKTAGSWPDKVHNVPLEVLATSGIFAFFLFLALFAWSLKSLWGNVNRTRNEKILYSAALIAFFIQNCFAFDTIISLLELTFFLAILNPIPLKEKPKPALLIWSGVAGLGVFCIWIFFLFPTAQAFKLLHTANENTGVNNQRTYESLNNAKNLPFVYDLERIGKYLITLHKNELGSSNPSLILNKQIADTSLEVQNKLSKIHPQKAYVWYLYATSLNLSAYTYQTPNSETSFEIANKVIQLAPNRSEGFVTLSNLYDTNGDLNKATFYAKQAVEIAPTDAETLWNLAYIYLKQEKIQLAAEVGLKSVQNGLKPTSIESFNWLINYFIKEKNHATVVYLYERALLIYPNNIQLLPKLAAAYAINNQTEKAIEIANKLKEKDPSSTTEVDAFIRSIKNE
jgi:O-antigen ligase